MFALALDSEGGVERTTPIGPIGRFQDMRPAGDVGQQGERAHEEVGKLHLVHGEAADNATRVRWLSVRVEDVVERVGGLEGFKLNAELLL